MNYQLLNGSNLAYIGDAYYELEIRKYLLNKNLTKNKELRKISIEFVSAASQAFIYNNLKDSLTEEENKIFLRGRNSVHHFNRKNVDHAEYLTATGFEAIIGYLYLKGDKVRLDEIMNKSIEIVVNKNGYIW